MANTMGHTEARENRSRVAAENDRMGIPDTADKNNGRQMGAEPVERSVADIAARFMGKYDQAFEELAKF